LHLDYAQENGLTFSYAGMGGLLPSVPAERASMKPVVIVGTNVATRDLIDWNIDGDYWVFNEVAALDWPKRVDGCFQMHLPPFWRSKKNVNYAKYYEWLKLEHPYPIWMIDTFEDVPSSVKYPKDRIVSELLQGLTDEKGQIVENFTSSVAYAIAMACLQKRPVIHLYGIEMAAGTEFFRQKAGFYFWCGIALGLGIKIIKHSKSLLFAEPIYGYKGEVMIQRSELELSKAKYDEEASKLQADMFEAQGSLKALLEAMFIAPDQKTAEKLGKVFLDALREAQDLSFKYGQAYGAASENARYIGEVQAMLDAAGGERALETMVINGLT
jgi:hypothetical protein